MKLSERERCVTASGDFAQTVMRGSSLDDVRKLVRWSLTNSAYSGFNCWTNEMTAGGITVPTVGRQEFPDKIDMLGPDLQKRIQVQYGIGDTAFTIIRRSSVPDFGLEYTTYALSEYDEASLQNKILLGQQCEYILWEQDPVTATEAIPAEVLLQRSPLWLVPIPLDLTPAAIISHGRTLLLGVDFFVGSGVLILQEHPSALWDHNAFCYRTAFQRVPHILDHVVESCGVSSIRDIIRLRKGHFAASAIRLACARVAGLSITPKAGILDEARPLCQGYEYRFEFGIMQAPYDHDMLEVGVEHPADTIAGAEMIKVHKRIPGSISWHRSEIDWSGGLSLDAFCPVKGLVAPDYPVKIEVTSQTGDLDHAQMWLVGTDEARAQYWEWCKQAEIKTGFTLAAALGLTNIGEFVFKNPIDVLFEYGNLCNSAVVVTLRTSALTGLARRRIVELLDREKPAGAILIIR